jgi:hypothetical protein
MSAARDRLCPLMWILNGEHQTTNLGVGSSNLSGRANLRDIPCESHGKATQAYILKKSYPRNQSFRVIPTE